MDQLRELLGTIQVRGLFDPAVVARLEAELQYTDGAWQPRDKDDLLDVVRRVGDVSETELATRFPEAPWRDWLQQLRNQHAVTQVRIWGETRLIATEDAARYRDALGVVLPIGLPTEYLHSSKSPLDDLILRYAKTHGPFAPATVARHFHLAEEAALQVLEKLEHAALIVRGEFLLEGQGMEYVHPDVLRRLRRWSLADLRQQMEPLDAAGHSRFLLAWHGVGIKQRGLDAVLNVIEQLQGNVLGYQVWVKDVLPSRVVGFTETDLDELCSAGEVVWRASGSLSDPRVAFYLTDSASVFLEPPGEEVGGVVAQQIREHLAGAGLFFPELVSRVGGFPGEVFDTLWSMVWSGEVSNDSLRPLRALLREGDEKHRRARPTALDSSRRFRSRRRDTGLRARAGTEGRFTLLTASRIPLPPTERATARTRALVKQWGVVTREAVGVAKVSGGFSSVYPILRGMDETGELQRGYWIEGLGATQFVPRGVVNQIRVHRELPREEQWVIVAATDPVNVYGVCFQWPPGTDPTAPRPARAVGASVVLERGRPLAWFTRSLRQVYLFEPPDDCRSDKALQRLAEVLRDYADRQIRVAAVEQINGEAPMTLLAGERVGSGTRAADSREGDPSWPRRFANALCAAGFDHRPTGLVRRRVAAPARLLSEETEGR
jgi:ATP-dependent Lhr-like helicase